MAGHYAARHPQYRRGLFRFAELGGAVKAISTSSRLRQHAGPDGNHFLRRVRQGLLGMHQKVEKHLLQLPVGAQHVEGLPRSQIAHANA